MVKVDYLKRVLEVCASHSVQSIKIEGLEIHFAPKGAIESQDTSPASNEPIIEALKKQEESLPPDLRADDLMNHDKVLNWSSPDAGDQLPLTGEQEL